MMTYMDTFARFRNQQSLYALEAATGAERFNVLDSFERAQLRKPSFFRLGVLRATLNLTLLKCSHTLLRVNRRSQTFDTFFGRAQEG